VKTRIPPGWEVVHRLSLVSLVKLERDAFITLRDLVRSHDGMLVNEIANKDLNGVLKAIKKSSNSLYEALWETILDIRAEARKEGFRALVDELNRLQDDVDDSFGAPEVEHWSHADEIHAQAAAASFRAAWTAAVMAAVMRAYSRDESTQEAISLASRLQDYRLARIARTEASRAFNQSRKESLKWISERHDDRNWIAAIFKRWDATLDSRVCAICRDLDGTYVPAGFDFPDGNEPGDVHVNCRCIQTLIYLPVPLSESKAQAG
jgi:hypothetical protein